MPSPLRRASAAAAIAPLAALSTTSVSDHAGRGDRIFLEAIMPISGASGHRTEAVASADLYIDDILPDTLGKPLFDSFGARQP